MPYQTMAGSVIFSTTDAVIPDVVWVSRDRLAKGIGEAGHLVVTPELIVEILSPGNLNRHSNVAAVAKI
jgi:Uma2 family endonuclease